MKIEIMDLLHKIYNLDDMPGKIIFDNCVWRYCSEFQDYQSEKGYLFGDYMSHINETLKFLNAEVETLQEDKSIIEKINIESDSPTHFYIRNEYGTKCGLTKHSKMIADKLNEIIDYINRKEDK